MQEIHLRLVSTDVVHGFFLEGHDIEAEIRPGSLTSWVRHPSTGEDFRETEEIVFTAGRPGKYRYRCSVTCGTLHPFMQGEMIVRPNNLYRVSLIATFGLALAVFGLMMTGVIGDGTIASRPIDVEPPHRPVAGRSRVCAGWSRAGGSSSRSSSPICWCCSSSSSPVSSGRPSATATSS